MQIDRLHLHYFSNRFAYCEAPVNDHGQLQEYVIRGRLADNNSNHGLYFRFMSGGSDTFAVFSYVLSVVFVVISIYSNCTMHVVIAASEFLHFLQFLKAYSN